MRILVADDHDLVRETIAAFLQGQGIDEVASVGTLCEAMKEIENTGGFDLVLLDYHMPGMEGLRGLSSMIRANAGKPVALLSGSANRNIAEAAVQAGAAGFVPKTLGAKSMMAAIMFMAAGETYLPIEFLHENSVKADSGLTRRESQVLRGICEGRSNKEIARIHDVQEVTVKLHVRTLCRKLGAKNRTRAAMIARDRNIV